MVTKEDGGTLPIYLICPLLDYASFNQLEHQKLWDLLPSYFFLFQKRCESHLWSVKVGQWSQMWADGRLHGNNLDSCKVSRRLWGCAFDIFKSITSQDTVGKKSLPTSPGPPSISEHIYLCRSLKDLQRSDSEYRHLYSIFTVTHALGLPSQGRIHVCPRQRI